MVLRIRAYGEARPLNAAANTSLRRGSPAQWRCEYELTETPTRSMVLRIRAYGEARPLNAAANTSLRRGSPAQWRCEYELTETPTRSMALRIRAYGDAHLLNDAEHRSCWGRLKAHPRRIPHPCPRIRRQARKRPFPVLAPSCETRTFVLGYRHNAQVSPTSGSPPHSSFRAALRLRDGCAMHPRRIRDGCATPPRRLAPGPRRLRDGSVPAPLEVRPTSAANIQSKAEPSPGNWRAFES